MMASHTDDMPYDLKRRTSSFAADVRKLVTHIPKSIATMEDCKQVIRSSGSVGANYREADEALSNDDFLYRIKLCRKESKETVFWLELLHVSVPEHLKQESLRLQQEATELMKIFSAIHSKRQQTINKTS